jgi:hypothetical protein
MKKYLLSPVLAGFGLIALSTLSLHAQITAPVRAHIAHSFMIGDKTMPPGNYTFRVESNTNQGAMEVQNEHGDVVAQLNVRQSIDNRMPKHSEIVFKRYGNTEFLSKVYESGSKQGVSVTETGKEEARLVSQGQHAIEHTEEEE